MFLAIFLQRGKKLFLRDCFHGRRGATKNTCTPNEKKLTPRPTPTKWTPPIGKGSNNNYYKKGNGRLGHLKMYLLPLNTRTPKLFSRSIDSLSFTGYVNLHYQFLQLEEGGRGGVFSNLKQQ